MTQAVQYNNDDMNEAAQTTVTPSALPLGDISHQARVMEAVLFASSAPMTASDLRTACGGDDVDLGAVLGELSALYQNRGVSLYEIDGKWAFRTAQEVAPYLRSFRQEERKLPRAALETLAIIAYHQPITRTEIENIRGVAVSKGTIDLLMEMGWVKPGRRRDIPGRPLTWITTSAFLDHFGLTRLADLPGMDDLKASGLLDARPAIETIDLFEREEKDLEKDAGGHAAAAEEGDDLELLASAETTAAVSDEQWSDEDYQEGEDE